MFKSGWHAFVLLYFGNRLGAFERPQVYKLFSVEGEKTGDAVVRCNCIFVDSTVVFGIRI